MKGLPDFNLNLPLILFTLEAFIKKGDDLRAKLTGPDSVKTYDNIVLSLARFHHELHCFWSPVSHLNAVKNTPELRAIYDAGVVAITEYQTRLGQDEALFRVYKELQNSPDFAAWPEARQRVVENAIRDFSLSGVDLPDAQKQHFQIIEAKLTEASTAFEHHLMDAIDAWEYYTESKAELEGLPGIILASAREKARARGMEGYLFGIDAPTYGAIITHAKNRALRDHFYEAYVTRASDLGEKKFDNSTVMLEILDLRFQLAKLLKYDSFAAVSLATKMAKTTEQVLSFLRDLAVRSTPRAKKELDEIHGFAKKQGIGYSLEAYDLPYFSEQLKASRFGFCEEDLRPFFPLSQVMMGLFKLLERLFGIRLVEKNVAVWDKAVRFYEVYDEQHSLRGGIYMDLFARAHKRSGAWMDDARGRFFGAGLQDDPIAFLTCNFLGSSDEEEPCLLHEDIVTLFHEMGHVLQHILTQVNEPDVAGIAGIPWDAVELPSQFLENFAWQPEVLKCISCHIKTKAPLDDTLIDKLRATKSFQGALQMLRQIEFALFDFLLYHGLPPTNAAEIAETLNHVRAEVAVVKAPEYNRFQHGFSHIFAGGYAAGYYSYKWAEVLSADAFGRFEEEGLLDAEVGKAFRETILESGGARDAMELFIAFRGRAPKIDALLKTAGIK